MTDTLVNNNDPRHVNYHDLVPMTTVTSSGYTSCATTKSNPPPSYESCLANTHPFTTTCAVTMPTESITMDTTDVSNQQLLQQQGVSSSNPKRMRSCSEPTLPSGELKEKTTFRDDGFPSEIQFILSTTRDHKKLYFYSLHLRFGSREPALSAAT